ALELNARRPDAAFRYLERARAAAWADRPEGVPPLGIAEVQRHLPANTVLLEYAVLPDQVIAWVITQRAWRNEAIAISRDSVATLAARFGAESGMPVVPGGGARAQLYDLFLASAAHELDASAAVTVVPDRELSRVPFAALWNRKTEHYLVERLSVRTLPSAAFVAASAALDRRSVRHDVTRALVVGDPSFDGVAVPQVGRLPGAAREAARVAELYPEHKLLIGTDAGRTTTVALLPQYSIFHFAGHAITNLEQPELSYLAFAADGPDSDGI